MVHFMEIFNAFHPRMADNWVKSRKLGEDRGTISPITGILLPARPGAALLPRACACPCADLP